MMIERKLLYNNYYFLLLAEREHNFNIYLLNNNEYPLFYQ